MPNDWAAPATGDSPCALSVHGNPCELAISRLAPALFLGDGVPGRRNTIEFVVVVLIPVLGGCTGTARTRWVDQHGGVLRDSRHERVEAVAQRVVPQHLLGTIKVRVLDTGTISAFGWRDGSVYVTRGLVDRCTDEQLAAAIAHELGHLFGDGHLPPFVGLRGCERDFDEEQRADQLGVALLRARGLPPGVMAEMLGVVMNSGGPKSTCRLALLRRIRLIRDQLGP